MGKFIDITGQRFARLVVLSRAENRNKLTCWNCICDCGKKDVMSKEEFIELARRIASRHPAQAVLNAANAALPGWTITVNP